MMVDTLKLEMIDALIAAALKSYAADEVGSAPSDEELAGSYPLTGRDAKLLKKYIKKEKQTEKRVKEPAPAALYFKRAAIALMVTLSVFTSIMMTSTEVRAAVGSAVVGFFEKYVKINFTNSEDPGSEETDDIYKMKIGYIPEGFELIESDETDEARWYTYYRSEDDKYLFINLNYTDSSESDVDIEQYDMTEIKIGRFNGYLFYNDNEKAGTLIIGNRLVSIGIDGDMSKDELIKIAENIK